MNEIGYASHWIRHSSDEEGVDVYQISKKAQKEWISLNPVLSQLELQQCKKFFTGRMMEMTKMFNDVAKKLWNPSQ